MGLAALQNQPNTPQEFAQWSFSHMAHHRDILRVIYQTRSQNLTEYVLDPFDPSDQANLNAWLANHQVMHQQMDSVLGIPQNILSELDWSDQEQVSLWLSNHFVEHSMAGQILGV